LHTGTSREPGRTPERTLLPVDTSTVTDPLTQTVVSPYLISVPLPGCDVTIALSADSTGFFAISAVLACGFGVGNFASGISGGGHGFTAST